jgi:hypothetical protein
LSLAAPKNSVNQGAYDDVHWSDAWWDRSRIESVVDLGGNGVSDEISLYAGGIVSNTTMDHLMIHGAGQLGGVRLNNVQLSEFTEIGTDAIGSAAVPVGSVFEVAGFFKHSEVRGFYPAYSGNSFYEVGLRFRGLFLGSSIRNCDLGGDNRSTIGLRFEPNYGNFGIIEACQGSLLMNQPNEGWNHFVSIIGSRMAPSDIVGAGATERDGTGFGVFMGSPDNGGTPNEGSFRVARADKAGRTSIDLELDAKSLTVGRPLFMREGGQLRDGSTLSGMDKRNGATTWTIDSQTGAANFRELRVGEVVFGPELSAVSPPIGGRILGGECKSEKVTLRGSTPGMTALVTPIDITDPGDRVVFRAFVSLNDEITMKICAIQATQLELSRYRVRLFN